jgi:hypothetical protein
MAHRFMGPHRWRRFRAAEPIAVRGSSGARGSLSARNPFVCAFLRVCPPCSLLFAAASAPRHCADAPEPDHSAIAGAVRLPSRLIMNPDRHVPTALPTARFPLTLRHAAGFHCHMCGPAFRLPLPRGRYRVPVGAAAAHTLRVFILEILVNVIRTDRVERRGRVAFVAERK